MLFSSIDFLFFFSIFLACLVLIKQYQRYLIIILSLFFYSYWNIYFTPLIIFYCLITIFLLKKNYSFFISIPIILLPLFYFKYSFFILNSINSELLIDFSYKGELPLAISFVTFTVIAVIVDRKGKPNNEYTFTNISEYILYFPQLIAGPILRLNQLFPQLNKKINFLADNIKFGILLFCVGYIKKVYFADNIALIIDPFFEDPGSYGSNDLIKAFLLFPIQIYFDFSGYIDMALGISLIFGIILPQNFNKPYLCKSLTDFWRRWHITLSNWFRDYIYIPMGGSREGKFKLYFNLIITMSIAGAWHGASFNFILWGFLNGLILSLEKVFNFNESKYSVLKNFLVCFLIFNLWIVFRIPDFGNLYIFFESLYIDVYKIFNLESLLILFFVIFLIFLQKFENFDYLKLLSKKLNFSFIIPFFVIIILVGLSISLGQSEKFIYFQF
tara:strand:- start:2230 stop:3558 length:1329 start_codon:yes stop_codon:yes gene_type:complete